MKPFPAAGHPAAKIPFPVALIFFCGQIFCEYPDLDILPKDN